jgi:hypothetical protein
VEQSNSLEANKSSPIKEIPCIVWNTKFHYHFHKRPPSASPGSDQPSPCHYPKSKGSILILSLHPRLGPPSGLVPWGLSTQSVYAPILSPYVLMPRLFHYSWFDRPNNIWWAVRVKVKVKLSLYRRGQTHKVAGGWDCQISRQSADAYGKVASPTHRPH